MKQDLPHHEKLPVDDTPPGVNLDETLITDARAGLTPMQMVERKLASLSQSTPLPLGFLSPILARHSRRSR
jgi:hypothetical protein